MKKILVIGNGIAGALLSYRLRQKGAFVDLADAEMPSTSSQVAAGIINPVTGQRFVKSWRFEEFFPEAMRVYQQLEQELGVQLWEERPILRLLATPGEVNDWSVRCALPEYAGYLDEQSDAGGWSPVVKPGFQVGVLRNAGRVSFPNLTTAWRQKLQAEGRYLNQHISHEDIKSKLKDYDAICCCRGAMDADNPYFPDLKWKLAKGEALVVRLTERPADYAPPEMLKKTIMLTAIAPGQIWVGGTYEWNTSDKGPTKEGRKFLEEHLQQLIAEPYEILEHRAAIRPTTHDRRPYLKQSDVDPRVFLFNGLGTKGALMGPLLSDEMADFIMVSGK